jgi:hypothetical protein
MKREIVEIKVADMQKHVYSHPESYPENAFYTKRIVTVDGMPVVEIAPAHPDIPGFRGRRMWLSPFRGYSFQVSSGAEGRCAIGCSEVVGLANVVDAQYGTTREHGYESNVSLANIHKELLLGLASRAMINAQAYGGRYEVIIPDDKLMKEFIDMVSNYIKSYQ